MDWPMVTKYRGIVSVWPSRPHQSIFSVRATTQDHESIDEPSKPKRQGLDLKKPLATYKDRQPKVYSVELRRNVSTYTD
ncbi:hypothetical protein Fmac_032586 [Flemingia macrophylla]|uniref:Uncharacterized protein n=1 Tax=Flemingia macrophylla TaxID=520843 RepID=A0ABD1L6Q5_9FABA